MHVQKLFMIGALTSKPYAFTARSWELKNTESLDVFDSVGSNIKISTRGSSVLRILPKINDKINEEWITDKVRFSYDAFKFQRILHCYIKSNNSFVKINWSKVFGLLYKKPNLNDFFKIDKVKNTIRINFFVGSFTDLETINFLKRFVLDIRQNSVSVLNNSLPSCLNFDFRSNYIFNEKIHNVDTKKYLSLVFFNPRLEAPAFNLRIRKNVLFKDLKVFNLGFNANLTYKVKNVGLAMKSILGLIEGKFFLSKFLFDKNNSISVFGSSFFNVKNNEYVYSVYKKYIPNTIFISAEASSLNFYEVGFSKPSIFEKYKGVKSVNWLLDEDKSVLLNKSQFTIYTGHHGDLNFKSSNLVLPSTLFSEKNSTYINYQGFVQNTKFTDSSVLGKDVRDDLVFMKTFIKNGKNNLDVYKNNKKILVYDVKNYNSEKLSFVNNNYVSYYMKDFYRNDSISRNSPIMALTSNRLNYRKSSFLR